MNQDQLPIKESDLCDFMQRHQVWVITASSRRVTDITARYLKVTVTTASPRRLTDITANRPRVMDITVNRRNPTVTTQIPATATTHPCRSNMARLSQATTSMNRWPTSLKSIQWAITTNT